MFASVLSFPLSSVGILVLGILSFFSGLALLGQEKRLRRLSDILNVSVRPSEGLMEFLEKEFNLDCWILSNRKPLGALALLISVVLLAYYLGYV
ncbi:MAG: hypothetical protein JW937_10535 [Candidatus Omnitrophica bacterium]|nr:hypothetical protein [Candidatus Omnitrophota bacterium]